MSFILRSPAFEDGGRMPDKYTRDGGNISPPLKWEGAPDDTQSFALIIDDPDAPSGTFRHWALYNLKPDLDGLPEGADDGALGRPGHGVNDFGNDRYDGPAPPKGHGVHHYHFRLAALDVPSLDLPRDATVAKVWKEAESHIIDQAELVGTYSR